MGTDGCDGDVGWGLDEKMVYNCGLLSTEEFNLEKAIVYDINGRQITSINLENMSDSKAIDLSNVASGMYFMTIISNSEKHVIKLIKK